MKTDKATYYANRGVARNKRPLKNIVYVVNISKLSPVVDEQKYEQFRWRDEGFLILSWYFQEPDPIQNWHGFITPEDLKTLLGQTQWAKFTQGKRLFIEQRRENGRNLPRKTDPNSTL